MPPVTRAQPEFVTHCLDLLGSVGPCVAKRMFGGWGISTGGLTFAIIADLGAGERLYLKTDDTTRPRFEVEGCVQFVYEAQGKSMRLGYHTAPDEAMESAGLMRPWAALAMGTATQTALAKTPKKRAK